MSSRLSRISVKGFDRHAYVRTVNLLKEINVNTVCMEANCPNRYECFSNNTATLMILGNRCTRDCRYCNVNPGVPEPLDKGEPTRVANAVKALGLRYVVITCVARDDLEDSGTSVFIETMRKIRARVPGCRIELLISDLNGNLRALRAIVAEAPDVLNHNIEVAKPLFHELRPQGNYSLSMNLLKSSKRFDKHILTKSGLMVGLGESKQELIATMKELAQAKVDILTLGQYLQPSPLHASVQKYYTQAEFDELQAVGLQLGIKQVVAGPLVRSSFKAAEVFRQCVYSH